MKDLSPIDQYIWNPMFEDKNIQSFGETLAPETKVKDFKKAEDQVEKEEKEHREKDKEDLEQQRQEQEAEASEDTDREEEGELPEMCKRLLEYGTPAGVNSSGGCKSCGCEDAADAAIIDAEIEESEGSDKKKEHEKEGETGADNFGTAPASPEPDLGTDLTMYLQEYERLSKALDYRLGLYHPTTREEIIACESVFETLTSSIGQIFRRVGNFGTHVYRAARTKIAESFMRATTVQRLWESRIRNLLSRISKERLDEIEIEALDRETWCLACRCAISLFELVKNGEKLITLSSAQEVTGDAAVIENQLAAIGIVLHPEKQSVEQDDFLHKSQYRSLSELGYEPAYMPETMRYFAELAKRVPSKTDITLEVVINRFRSSVTAMEQQINRLVDSGNLKPQSTAYRDASGKLANNVFKLNYLITCSRCCYSLIDRLLLDIKRVCEGYEKAVD